jgi:hypothetical protein
MAQRVNKVARDGATKELSTASAVGVGALGGAAITAGALEVYDHFRSPESHTKAAREHDKQARKGRIKEKAEKGRQAVDEMAEAELAALED